MTERNAKHGNLARGLSTEFLSETSQSKKPASEIIDLKRVVFPTWRGPINIIIFFD